MNNIQLWVTHKGVRSKLDLYEEDLPQISKSSEDLTNPTAVTGTFSNTFRLPATNTNTAFFKYFYDYNIADFDLTVVIQAELVVGSDSKFTGQLRLQQVYRNREQDLVDYEVLFLGEVRDFASQVGEINLNEIGGDLSHALTMSNIVTSWNAQAGTTNGLFEGNVLYPLAEYGYEYDNDGDSTFNKIASSAIPSPTGGNIFTNSSFPLVKEQWRPWVRAKWIIDQIFSLTDFEYDSEFLDSDLFSNIYINATGNTDRAGMQFQVPSANVLVNREPFLNIISALNVDVTAPYTVIVDDESNLWDGERYTVPITGSYDFEWNQNFIFTWSTTGTNCGTPQVTVEFWRKINGAKTVLSTSTSTVGSPQLFVPLASAFTLSLTAGDLVEVGYTVTTVTGSTCTYTFNAEFLGGFFEVLNAPIVVNPPLLLKNDVKAIDWLTSIFTKFNLIMQPQTGNPSTFTIEPFTDYVGTGERRDWTKKLDGTKDIQIQPIFYTQSEKITFTDQEGEDRINQNFQNKFNEPYGTRKLDSRNELLDGERVFETLFTPTPPDPIFGTTLNDMVIPKFTTVDTSKGYLTFDPVQIEPRILFYNGMVPAGLTWYYRDDTNTSIDMTTYPLVSPYSEYPTTSDTLNLNWRIENPVFAPGINTTTAFDLINGRDVYLKYWEEYILSLYDTESRLLIASFILDDEDLDVQFNDVIFVRDSWWRPIEIQNATLGKRVPVRVKLLKLPTIDLDYCDCRSWAVSDLRLDTSSAFNFTYLDCNGDQQSDSVQGNSIIVCSCEQPQIFLKDIRVTLAGTCVTPPAPVGNVPTRTTVSNETPIGFDFHLQMSTSQDIIDNTPETIRSANIDANEQVEFDDTLDSQKFVSLGEIKTSPGDTVDLEITFIVNDEVRQIVNITATDEESQVFLSTAIEEGTLEINIQATE